jgi:hypothetical protein
MDRMTRAAVESLVSSASDYRAKGESCLSRAAETNDAETARLFRELAADYFALAANDSSQPVVQLQQQVQPEVPGQDQ